ncbi:MAG TPA: serine/threonine-protein kinase, partial [Planctomycetota bacterium]|nr:serine/threonine-protein kinase [Planctomycetota bacterium]
MDCLTRAQIDALARDPSDADASTAEHLGGCERCHRRLERARRDTTLLVELRGVATSTGPARAITLVPGYAIERELRRGGQGVVHVAVQEATRRRCAVKLLDGVRTARERRRFETEIELACRLRHPGIVSVYDSGVANDVPWFAMELVDGRTLDEWARETRASLRRRLELFARVCGAVAYAHRRGVIHRDLKPANILVDADGEPRILDFGAAIGVDSERLVPRVTAPGEFLGTLAYAAPEQLSGDGSEVDTRTDVHALGLVLYELLAARLPYATNGSVAEIVTLVTSGIAPPPSRWAAGIDADLDAIVLTAIEIDPARRYASVHALERDVLSYLAGEPLQVRARGRWDRIRKRLARHRTAIAAATLALAIGGSFSGAWLKEHQRAERQREQAALVRAVFQDILSAAAPQRMGADVRLLEVFELAARSIEDSLRDAPDVQGAMELTIGETYRKLLRSNEAVPHLRRALERFRAVDGGHELEVARCANLLGLALSDSNEPEAVAVLEQALALRSRLLPETHVLVAESRRSLAIALLSQFKSVDRARAEQLLARAADAFRAAHGESDPDLAETKLWQVHTLRKDDAEQAGLWIQEALEALETSAPDDPRTIAALNARASWAQSRGSFDEARSLLDRASELTRRLYGDVLATDLIRRHARLAFAQGDAATAEQMSRQAVA